MKKASLFLLLLPVVGWAGGHNVNQEQNTVVVVNSYPGPQGPVGSQGVPGLIGPQGPAGQDYDGDHRLTTNIGADIQWYDWKHASIHSGYRYDLNHKGHMVDIGVFTIKIGNSYQDRKIEELDRKINQSTIQRVHPENPVIAIPLKSIIRGN